jgi:ferrochelatase
VRVYLREFLSDRRIVAMPRWIWLPILEGIILRVRPKKSAEKYASVWLPQGSPLLVHTQAQTAGVADRLHDRVEVRFAMRYGQPNLPSVLDELRRSGVSRVLVLPLFPQYSTTTTGSIDDVLEAYGQPEGMTIERVRDYHTDAGYIEAMAHAIEAAWDVNGRPDFAAGDRLLLSYHGIPVSLVRQGDPYPEQCASTTTLLRQRLGLTADEAVMTYQSKFGPAPWLTPATIDTMAEWGAATMGRVDVFCPGFAADCLETDEEINILNREAFLEAGGGEFHRIPCLNADKVWLDSLAALIDHEVSARFRA